MSGHRKVSWCFAALGFHLLFLIGCADVRKTTNEYLVVVDNLELRLIASSFSSYADKGPPTPGELAMQGRTIPRDYPITHLEFDQGVGRVDILNTRAGLKFTINENRADKPLKNWQQFLSWYANLTKERYIEPHPCTAFGLEGMLVVRSKSIEQSSLRRMESYYFLTDAGAVVGIHFSSYDYGSPVPVEDHQRVDQLLEELKRGISITER